MQDPSLLVLASLADGPKHGYAIMQDAEAFAGVRMGPGTLYGAITRLEERAMIRPVGPKTRRQAYAITPSGSQHLRETVAAHDRVSRVAKARLRDA